MKLNRQRGGHARAESGSASRERKAPGGARRALLIVIIVLAVLCAGCAAGVAAVSGIDAVYPNVTLDGIEIGGMTDIELARTLSAAGYDTSPDESVTVELPMGCELVVRVGDVCTESNIADIVDSVMSACRGSSALGNAVSYVKCLFSGMELESGSERSVDETAVRAKVENAVKEVNAKLTGSQVKIGEASLTVAKGASAVTVDVDEICRLITEALRSESYGTIEYEARVSEDVELDLDKLYQDVYSEPKDAEYDPETGEITEETNGVSFDMAEARRLWNAAKVGDEVEIPLDVVKPKVTADSLRELLFRDCFLKKATTLVGSSSNRINNITKAAAAIDGIVLMPGEEFSYNDALGERTAANGYLPAGAYSGGQTVQEYGGGICQVSSALYCCALYANLEITARTCHMFPVAYVPPGMDATVSWGGPEFKFKNSRDYPVKIVAYIDGDSVVVELWGTDVDGSYVEMTYGTSTIYDSKYTDVAIGYKATTYRSIFDKDGNLLDKRLEARSTYKYHDEDIKWPEETPEPTESPEVTPEPSESPDVTPEPAPEPEPTPTPEPETPVQPTPEPEFPDPPFWEE